MATFMSRLFGQAAEQEYDENTLLLLHGDDLTDSSMYGRPITANGVESIYGPAAIGLRSLNSLTTAGYISVPYSADLDFGTGDFTIEFWLYLLESSANAYVYVGQPTNAIALGFGPSSAFSIGRVSVAWDTVTSEAIGTITRKWMHLAAVRSSGRMYLFKDGQLLKSASNTFSYNLVNSALTMPSQSGTPGIRGYFDEVRVSNVARWTSNFTPPTEAYKG